MPKMATHGYYDLTLSCDGVDAKSTEQINVKFIEINVSSSIPSMRATEKRIIDVSVEGISEDLCSELLNFRIYLENTLTNA